MQQAAFGWKTSAYCCMLQMKWRRQNAQRISGKQLSDGLKAGMWMLGRKLCLEVWEHATHVWAAGRGGALSWRCPVQDRKGSSLTWVAWTGRVRVWGLRALVWIVRPETCPAGEDPQSRLWVLEVRALSCESLLCGQVLSVFLLPSVGFSLSPFFPASDLQQPAFVLVYSPLFSSCK